MRVLLVALLAAISYAQTANVEFDMGDYDMEESSSMDSEKYAMSENGFFTMYGDCDVVGDCVSSSNYPANHGNNENCDITVLRDSSVSVTSLSLESCCDHLSINGMSAGDATAVPTSMHGGSDIHFSSDFSVTMGGFQLCFSDAFETERDCDACVSEFVSLGGCACWMDETCEIDALVPAGCDHCGEPAAAECGIDMEDDDDNIEIDECAPVVCGCAPGHYTSYEVDSTGCVTSCSCHQESTAGPSDSEESEESMEESSMEDSYQDVWSENHLFHMMGNCDVVGDCVSSNNFPGSYGNNEYCSISVMQDSEVSVDRSFMLETCCDNLYIDGVDVENRRDVPRRMRAGSYISFSTDFSVTEGGFQLCFTAATRNECTACVDEFVMYGGCECWMDEMCNVEDLVPVGCGECGEDAAMACGIDWEDTSMDDDEHDECLSGCWDCQDNQDACLFEYDGNQDPDFDTFDCNIACTGSPDEPEVTYCSGMMGDYDCVCESGEKYAVFHGGYDTTMSPTTEPTYMRVRGRRRAAVYGEEMYCEMGNSCIYSEEADDALAGSLSNFYKCMNLDTWEVYEVSTHFPYSGDVMPEGSSYAYCDDYAFSCFEEGIECDSYYNGDWMSLPEECQCITGSVEYTDNNDGYYGGANGCKSCNGWNCAECFDGFMMNEWNMCVRMETTSEPAGAFFEMDGDCEVVDDCVQSANYPGSYGNNERCDIRMLRDADLTSGRRFSFENCCDHLMINGVDVESAEMLPSSLTAGTTFTFTTDYSVTSGGWQICFTEMSPETMDPSFMPTEMPLSASPSTFPSKVPSSSPTFFTKKPSNLPTAVPIVSLPTAAPSADCSDNPEWTNNRGWDCDRAVRKRVNLGSTCVNDAMITNCCASCAEADALLNTNEPAYDEIICPDGYAYNGDATFVDVDGDTTECSGVNRACSVNGCNMDEVHAYMINQPCCTIMSPEPTMMPTPEEVVSTSYFEVSGDCDVTRNCVSSKDYPNYHGNHDQCTITILADAAVRVGSIFELEMCCDNLLIQGHDIHAKKSVPGFLAAGETISWSSDFSVTSRGWQLCFSEYTEQPSFMPTATNPSNMPSVNPSFAPTGTPSNKPSPNPSEDPTSNPTTMPTETPTETPSADPTSSSPTFMPTSMPTEMPTQSPTMMPSPTPSADPTSSRPTEQPTEQPTESPTTLKPTEMPTMMEPDSTVAPTCYPPDASLLESMRKLLDREPTEERFVKVGQRAAAILQDAKKAGESLCDNIAGWLQDIKRFGKQTFSEGKWNKMQTKYEKIMQNL